MKKPPSLVWLPADHRLLGSGEHTMPYLVLGDKYARAVREVAQAQPVMFPLAQASDIRDLLDLVDGVLLPGSPSNIHPSHFGEDVEDETLPLDPIRDALTLELVRACVDKGVPMLGICRGFQEINVAMGGSLTQRVHFQPGMLDHREDPAASIDVRYAPSHAVNFVNDSDLAKWAGASSAMVNTVHGQGVAQLAPGLRAVARAPDGLVEAFEVQSATTFALAVQWHPEWRPRENPFYKAIFEAFGAACQKRHETRTKV